MRAGDSFAPPNEQRRTGRGEKELGSARCLGVGVDGQPFALTPASFHLYLLFSLIECHLQPVAEVAGVGGAEAREEVGGHEGVGAFDGEGDAGDDPA